MIDGDDGEGGKRYDDEVLDLPKFGEDAPTYGEEPVPDYQIPIEITGVRQPTNKALGPIVLVPVPKHRIYKAPVICQRCNGGMLVKAAQPFADGYHRRNVCRDCGHNYYTLAPYDGSEPMGSNVAFLNRALTPYELQIRDMWWDEDETRPVKLVRIADNTASLVRRILVKPDKFRTDQEQLAVNIIETVVQHLRDGTEINLEGVTSEVTPQQETTDNDED